MLLFTLDLICKVEIMDTKIPLLSQDTDAPGYPSDPNSSAAAAAPPPYAADQCNTYTPPPTAAGGYPAPYPAAQPQNGGGEGYHPYQPPPAQVPMTDPLDPSSVRPSQQYHVNSVVKPPIVKDYCLMSAVISVGVVVLCMPWLLLFTLPAILMSCCSLELVGLGKIKAAKTCSLFSLICNIAAIVSYPITLVLGVIIFVSYAYATDDNNNN